MPIFVADYPAKLVRRSAAITAIFPVTPNVRVERRAAV